MAYLPGRPTPTPGTYQNKIHRNYQTGKQKVFRPLVYILPSTYLYIARFYDLRKSHLPSADNHQEVREKRKMLSEVFDRSDFIIFLLPR